MPPSSGLMAPIAMRMLRQALTKAKTILRSRLSELSRPVNGTLEPVLIRNTPKHPIHPVAALRQRQARWYSTSNSFQATVRRFTSESATGVKYDRSKFPKSTVSGAVSRLSSRAPFATTLRPNLTGGAMPRTAGGYTIGGTRAGGARYFSHTPAAPAEIVNNVSAAVRAFWLSGQKAQFDGMSPLGEKKFRSVSALEKETSRKLQSIAKRAPGSYIDFKLNPTVTALSPLAGAFGLGSSPCVQTTTLSTEGFLDILSVDFSRALQDLVAVLTDLKRLASLGDLPVSMEEGTVLRVRFPGCDAQTVERLCTEFGVQRGIVREDADFAREVGEQIALMFPFCPSARTPTTTGLSLLSESDVQDLFEHLDYAEHSNPWLSSPEGYETMEALSASESLCLDQPRAVGAEASDYEGLEGLYRFIEECDRARRIS